MEKWQIMGLWFIWFIIMLPIWAWNIRENDKGS